MVFFKKDHKGVNLRDERKSKGVKSVTLESTQKEPRLNKDERGSVSGSVVSDSL